MYFDSYGIRFDNELKWLSLKQRQGLDELTPYLTGLLEGNVYDYNKIHYQQADGDISTCGMHVTYFLFNVLNNNMNLDSYHEYMQTLRKTVSAFVRLHSNRVGGYGTELMVKG